MNEFISPAKPLIGDEERAAVDRVMRSGMLAQGPEVKALEEEFAAHFGLGRACVAVNSGTSGLHLGLLSSRVRDGDEVIVPSFTFAATANPVALAGATPVFADINPDDFCLDPRRWRRRSPTRRSPWALMSHRVPVRTRLLSYAFRMVLTWVVFRMRRLFGRLATSPLWKIGRES